MVLVIHVRDRPQPIVRVVDDLADQLGGPRVVEPGEQHERAKPRELVLVALDRPNQRGRNRGGGRAPERPRRVHARRKIQVAERIDRGLNGIG